MFITLSVHLKCLQHVRRDAAHSRVGQRQLMLLWLDVVTHSFKCVVRRECLNGQPIETTTVFLVFARWHRNVYIARCRCQRSAGTWDGRHWTSKLSHSRRRRTQYDVTALWRHQVRHTTNSVFE